MTIYEEQRDERRRAAAADLQLRKYLGTLTPQARRQYLADQQAVLRGEEAPRQPVQPAQGGNMYGFGPFASAVGGYQAMMGNQLQGAANDVMRAIKDENESRVAQNREMRRMGHESGLAQQQMELERMRLENDRIRNQTDAANEIRKLKAMMAMQNPNAPRRRSLERDPMTGQHRWMEDWER